MDEKIKDWLKLLDSVANALREDKVSEAEALAYLLSKELSQEVDRYKVVSNQQ